MRGSNEIPGSIRFRTVETGHLEVFRIENLIFFFLDRDCLVGRCGPRSSSNSNQKEGGEVN
jgi:hypothetical protein